MENNTNMQLFGLYAYWRYDHQFFDKLEKLHENEEIINHFLWIGELLDECLEYKDYKS